MADLSIYLLGPPETRWKEKSISILRRVPRALLFYLASQGKVVGRDTLLTLFWEDQPDQVARRRLRESLSRLRGVLPNPNLLITHEDLVGLDFERVYVDQLEFLEVVLRIGQLPWQIPPEVPLPQEIFQLMARAIDLWRGPNFLDGADLPSSSSFDEWLTRTTQQLAHTRGRLLERLSDHARAVGNMEQALVLTGLALADDNLNEDLHFRVLRLLIEMGRRNEAQGYYAYLKDLFRRELNTQPSPRLTSLYKQIRRATGTATPAAQQTWRIWPSVLTPFVGRQQALEQLGRALPAGGGAIVFGESGQGKTRLLQEFSNQLKQQRRVLVALCRPAESSLPFQPFIDLFRNGVTPSEWLTLSPVWASRLSLLLPELMTLRPELEAPEPLEEPAYARSLLLEAIRQAFLLLAERDYLLLFLDDAQWADESTLSTVAYLLERPPFDHKALLVVAARREEPNPALEKLLAAPASQSHLRPIHLTQLSLEEITLLGSYVLHFTPEPLFVRQLARETGGNPLFILETLRALLEQKGQPEASGPVPLPLPESVHALIRSRLSRLSPLARQVIEQAAVIGAEFSPEIIHLATGLNLREVGRGLEELEQRLLVEVVAHSPEEMKCRFIHEKFREFLLDELNPLQSRLLYGQAARALESRLGAEDGKQAARLAYYFEAAGELELAFRYWLRAGQHARQLFSLEDASQIFSHAEKLLDSIGAQLSEEQIHQLYADWTEMAFEADDSEAIERQNANLLRLGRRRHSPLLIGTALDGLGDACMAKNQFAEGLAYTNQAIPYLEQGDFVFEQMDAYIHRGVFLYMLNRLDEAYESFQDALALGAHSRQPSILRARANAHYQISLVRTLAGWPQSGQDHALRSLEEARQLGHHHIEISAYSALSLARFFLGEYAQARQDNQRGMDLAERSQAHRMRGYLHAVRGMIELSLGEIGAALHHAQQAIELGERYGHQDLAAMGRRVLGDVDFTLDSYEAAVDHYQRGLQLSGQGFWAIDTTFRMGFALARAGQTDVGMNYLHQALHLSQESGLGIGCILAQTMLAYIHVDLGEWERAQQLAIPLEEAVQARSLRPVQVFVNLLIGIAALSDARLEEALEQFRLASDKAAVLCNPLLEIRALQARLLALRRAGQPEGAALHRLEELFDRLEASAAPESVRLKVQAYRQKVASNLGLERRMLANP